MPTITVGSETLTIAPSVVDVCADEIKTRLGLFGDTPAEILAAWSVHTVNELKDIFVERIGADAKNAVIENTENTAEAARLAAEAQADTALVIS